MPDRSKNPLIVQSDLSVFLETAASRVESARDLLGKIAEIERAPEHVHTYRITLLSLWNAAAMGVDPDVILGGLEDLSKYPVPDSVRTQIEEWMGRYGLLSLERDRGEMLRLVSRDADLLAEIATNKKIAPFLLSTSSKDGILVDGRYRGQVKMECVRAGWPVEDRVGYRDGADLAIPLRMTRRNGETWSLRSYQTESVASWRAAGAGVVALPCGSGKTIVGIAAMSEMGKKTLILSANTVAARQWRDEILDKTDLPAESIGEYSGERKEIRPVTIATYQILTHGAKAKGISPHMVLFDKEDWGLIIYDEVHLLPAPVFRLTAEIQSRRRLGLTATLVREDRLEWDCFALIGPKRYDVPWRELERKGWIAEAECVEIRVGLPADRRGGYAAATDREKIRIAATNPAKIDLVRSLLKEHEGRPSLVIGQYLDQLDQLVEAFGFPLITGKTPNRQREELYAAFRAGEIKTLIVSKVANFAIDLPDAEVLIQISGTFGSRQEEAQRLGRILRPKAGRRARFFSIVTRQSSEEPFAEKRQRFLIEQGYRYELRLA